MADKKSFVQGSLYEENYLVRTLGSLVIYPDIALTELVANAWDAGATEVRITIPNDYNQKLIIEDNGIGLTKEEFHNRWMKLGYDRLKHQGRDVKFPNGYNGKRYAFGRNGVGRHGLLCFNNEYTVQTNSGSKKSIFTVTTDSEHQPFVIKNEAFFKSDRVGTILEVNVSKNIPDEDKILNVLSARFIHDPNFTVYINGKTVPLEEHEGFINTKPIEVNGIKLKAHFLDSQKTATSTMHQGVAFWQGGRLVGEPSWSIGKEIILDGRTKFAKRYNVVIETNDLAKYIREDWTGFKKSIEMDEVYAHVSNYINEAFETLAIDNVEDTKQQIKKEFESTISSLPPLARFEVNEAIDIITTTRPTAKPEALQLAVEAIINLEKTRTGKELLVKLSGLSENDIMGLNTLLEKWSIRDALSVLDEIDNRLSVIEAIRKLSNDKDVDELHVLHPLVNAARWLFGPEFESSEYSSNRQLHTATEKLFGKKIEKGVFNNYKKRPDIVVVADSTLSVTGTETFDNESNLSTTTRILIIELKRGDFKLTRKERDQATGYVEDFMNCGELIGNPYINAFVVGKSFIEKVQPTSTVMNGNNVEMGKIRISTFAQLVDTAEKRLFGLREKLSDRYDDIPGMELYNRQVHQLSVGF
jgi:hypothetical protein